MGASLDAENTHPLRRAKEIYWVRHWSLVQPDFMLAIPWSSRQPESLIGEHHGSYLEGCDIASFDIYPAVHDKPEVAGKLEVVIARKSLSR